MVGVLGVVRTGDQPLVVVWSQTDEQHVITWVHANDLLNDLVHASCPGRRNWGFEKWSAGVEECVRIDLRWKQTNLSESHLLGLVLALLLALILL